MTSGLHNSNSLKNTRTYQIRFCRYLVRTILWTVFVELTSRLMHVNLPSATFRRNVPPAAPSSLSSHLPPTPSSTSCPSSRLPLTSSAAFHPGGSFTQQGKHQLPSLTLHSPTYTNVPLHQFLHRRVLLNSCLLLFLRGC